LSPNRNDDPDAYDSYEDQFDPLKTDRKARRARKPSANPHRHKAQDNVTDELVKTEAVEAGTILRTTYTPGIFESGWLLDAIRPFFDDMLVTDILGAVKGGKEASVYRCAANPATGHELLAAKVYRPRQFRNLRNDVAYREGREYLAGDNGALNEGDKREMRAIRSKSAYGVSLQHGSWMNYEFTTLQMLRSVGASVPEPISISENAILMSYVGDTSMAAPTLSQVSLDEDEAHLLFDEVLRNIRLLLQAGWIHGDLSAYNILYWEGAVTLIDFPQVTNAHANRAAKTILYRDVERVCSYFEKQGVQCDSLTVADRLWRGYLDTYQTVRAAEQSVLDTRFLD